MSSTDAQIVQLLQRHFANCTVEVINESHLHIGHAGDNGTGESHYTVHITWHGFTGTSRIARQRLVMRVLTPLLEQGPIHALSIRCDSNPA